MSEPKFTPKALADLRSEWAGPEFDHEHCLSVVPPLLDEVERLQAINADLVAALEALCARAKSGGYWAAERAKGEIALRKARGEGK